MNIYRINNDRRFAEVFPDLIGMINALKNLNEFEEAQRTSSPLKPHWVNHEGVIESKKKRADICRPYSSQLMLSAKVRERLDQELSSYGEFLPVTFEGEQYSLLNILNSIEADEQNSIRDMNDEDWFDEIAFKEKAVEGQLLWTTPLNHNCQIFCSQRFLDLIDEPGFKGLRFEESLPAT